MLKMQSYEEHQIGEFIKFIKKAVKEAIKEKDYEKENIAAIKDEDWFLP